MTSLAKVLQPVREPSCKALPCKITANQPDVEVLGFLTRRFPANEAAFEQERGSRDFVGLNYAVLAVGSAGFSRVPYTASKKGGDKDANQLSLYEEMDNGVLFYSYMKGKTNKDRGERMQDTEDESGASMSCTIAVQPGQCLSFCMRVDVYSNNGKFFADSEDIRSSLQKDNYFEVGQLCVFQP